MRSTKKASGNDFGWDTDGFEGGHTSRVEGLALCFLLAYVIRVCGRLRFFEKGKSGILVGVFFLLLSGVTPWYLHGQSPKMDLGYLYNENGVSFKLVLDVPRTRCGESAKSWIVRIIGNNVGKLRADQRYLSWKIPTINCAGYRINRAFSVNIKEFPFADGVPMMASDWNFVAASVDSMLMEVWLGPTERVEKDENLGLKDPLVFKGSIEGDSEITEGESVALQVVSSVRLREGAVLVWYEGSCGGKELQRGEVLRVRPAKTTTYYVRVELGQEVSECFSKEVVVHKKAVIPPEVASGKFQFLENLYKKDGLTVELYVVRPAIPCGTGAGDWEFRLRFLADPSYIVTESIRYLTWNVEIGDCSEFMVQKEFSLDLGGLLPFNPGRLVMGPSWRFEARQIIESQDFNARLQAFPNTKKDAVLRSLVKMHPPDSIAGNRTIDYEQTLKLRIVGPVLQAGMDWVWYEGACATGRVVAKGAVFEANPKQSTTYYVRSEIGSNVSPCKAVSVTVRSITRAPAGIVPEDGSANLCRGSSKTLEVRGGSLAVNAYWVWYQNSINEQNRLAREKTGKLTVNPMQTVTYIVRSESPDSVTSSVRFTLNVQGPPQKLIGIQNKSKVSICEGERVQLYAVGGESLKEDQLVWYKTNAKGSRSNLGYGREMTDNPSETSTYFVYAEGECGDSEPVQIGISVTKNSVNPTKEQIVVRRIDNEWKYSLQNTGGRLSVGQNWIWVEDSPDGPQIGEGPKIEFKTSKDARLYCKATGTCVSGPPAVVIVAGLKRPGYVFVNSGVIMNDFSTEGVKNVYLMIGGKRFYAKATILGGTLINELNAYDVTPAYVSNDVRLLNFPASTGTYYAFNSQKETFVGSYTLGTTVGAENFRVYAGVGFGFYDLLWGVDIYSYRSNILEKSVWAKNTERSFKGVAAETGIFLKIGNINFTGGIQVVGSTKPNSNYVSGQIGAGFQLK